jgi:hypothetical protein
MVVNHKPAGAVTLEYVCSLSQTLMNLVFDYMSYMFNAGKPCYVFRDFRGNI